MAEFFLVNKLGEIVKLNKGIPTEQVNELLGKEYKVIPSDRQDEDKRMYSFGNNDMTRHVYKVLIRGGVLEWVMKTSQY
jgi:hypothetical protein